MISAGVRIGKGTVIRDSIIMKDAVIGSNVIIDKSIIAEGSVVGDNCQLGIGDEVPNKLNAKVYSFGLATIGENTIIPPNVKIGKNTAVVGETLPEDYPNGILQSGESIIKAGDRV